MKKAGLFWTDRESSGSAEGAGTAGFMAKALDNAGIGLWHWNFAADPVWDECMKRLHGIEAAEETPSLDRFLAAIVSADFCDAVDEALWGARNSGAPLEIVYRIDLPGGGERWLRLVGQPESDGGGIHRLAGVCFDVSKQKQNEDRLIAASCEAADLTELFGLSTDLLCIAGFDGYYVRINPAWSRALGYDSKELLGRPFLDFVHPDDLASTRALYKQLESGDRSGSGFENRYRCKDGSYLRVVWSWTVDPRLERIYGLARVVGDKDAVPDPAESVNPGPSGTEFEQLASAASHAIREPLRMVTRYLEKMRERTPGLFDDQGDSYLGFVAEGAERVRGLIDGLRDFASLDGRALELENLALDEVLDVVLADLKTVIESTGARIGRDENLPSLQGDRTLLQALFRQLIANAILYQEPGATPVVRVGVQETGASNGGRVRVFVADNGIGIDPIYGDVVFELFQRLHSHKEYAGFGAGLAISRKIVALHGGRIWYEPGSQGGTVFVASLPAGE